GSLSDSDSVNDGTQVQNLRFSYFLSLLLWLPAHSSPHRRRLRIRVARRQQDLCLIGLEHPRRFIPARPPHKTSPGEPLLRQPEPLPVIDQDPDRFTSPAAEEHQAS